MVSVRVTGARELARTAGRLNATEPKLRRRLLAATRKEIKPAVEKIREAGADKLPSGLAEFLAPANYQIRALTSGKNAGVRLIGKLPGHDIYSLDKGDVRHPLWGNTDHWFVQSVPPGFWSETLEDDADRLAHEVLEVVARFTNEIT